MPRPLPLVALALAAAAMIAMAPLAARADCVLNGVSYPEGSVYGGYVCLGGHWVKR